MGSGLTGRSARNLQDALAPLHRVDSPFVDEVPSIDANGTTWVEPQVVVELKTLGSAEQSRLRHPAFLGIRHDLRPADLLEAQDADA